MIVCFVLNKYLKHVHQKGNVIKSCQEHMFTCFVVVVVFTTVKKITVVFFYFCFVTGDLEALKKQAFVLKEGVEYKIKISFKVSISSTKWSLNIIIV